MNNIRQTHTTVEQHDIVKDAIKALEVWKIFTTCCFGTTPKEGWLSAIKAVDISLTNLHTLYGVSVPNKIHIACDHVKDYILLTAKGLGHVNDQVVEASHSALNKRLMAVGTGSKTLNLIHMEKCCTEALCISTHTTYDHFCTLSN